MAKRAVAADVDAEREVPARIDTAYVQITRGGEVVHAGRVLRAGEVIEVATMQAERWVTQGLARPTPPPLRIRALRHCMVGNRNVSPGEEWPADEARARYLVEAGAAVIVNPESLQQGPPPVPRPPDPPKPIVPTVRVRALCEHAIIGNRCCVKGEEVETTRHQAVDAVVRRVAEGVGEFKGSLEREAKPLRPIARHGHG